MTIIGHNNHKYNDKTSQLDKTENSTFDHFQGQQTLGNRPIEKTAKIVILGC